MKTVKDACTVIPAVLLTATAMLGIGVLIGLSSWSLVLAPPTTTRPPPSGGEWAAAVSGDSRCAGAPVPRPCAARPSGPVCGVGRFSNRTLRRPVPHLGPRGSCHDLMSPPPLRRVVPVLIGDPLSLNPSARMIDAPFRSPLL